ncbi:MAG: TlpA disulfide reductase family protein [Proteobacteria bacterium]|nr:TlpA disulfide reductase family protein [Pseudomonadota bacterium]
MNSQEKKKRKHLIVSTAIIGSALILIGILVKGLTLNPSHVASTLINKPAQDFSTEILQGASWIQQSDSKLIKLSDLRGKPIVLNFWASWCVSCREEARYFEEFWQRYRESGVYVVGIAIQDTQEAALDFAKTYGKTYPLSMDVSGKASLDYGVYGVPETFFIDRSGVIRHKEAGPMSVALLEEKLQLIKN